MFSKALARLMPVMESQPLRSCLRSPCQNKLTISKDMRQFSCVLSSSLINPKIHSAILPCSCGCPNKFMHTKGDQELAKFLQQEIADEKKSMVPGLPSKFGDFTINTNQAQMILTRKFNDEMIKVTLDVNHSVDADSEAQLHEESGEAELKSKPSFEVDVAVGTRVMSFTCSFHGDEEPSSEEQNAVPEVFGINEVTVYDGEFTDNTYCVSGDILDPQLYDHLMNYLEERGVSEEFADKLSGLCSDYEHSLYVGLLEKIQSFVLKK